MMGRRRALMAAQQSGGGLPSEYQQCAWVASSTYVKTNVVISNIYPTVFNLKCYPTAFGAYGANVICIGTAQTNPIFNIGVKDGIIVNGNTVISNTTKNKILEITASVSSGQVDVEANIDGVSNSGSLVTSQSTWDSTNSSLYFWFQSNNRKMTGRIYSATINQLGSVIADFVPCYRKSDDVIGLYDLINRAFYETTGTKGADV